MVGALAALVCIEPAAAAKPRPCKPGQQTAVVKGRQLVVVKRAPRTGRRVCLRRPRLALSRAGTRPPAKRLVGSAALRPRRLAALERSRSIRRLRLFVARLEALLPGTRAAAHASRDTQTSTSNIAGSVFKGRDVPGGKAEMRTTSEAAGEGELGGYGEGSGEVSVGEGGNRIAQRRKFGIGGFADRCPDSSGRVAGTVKFTLGEGMTVKRADSKAIGGDWSLSFESTLEGQVGDNGRLTGFRYRGTAAAEFRGTGGSGRYEVRVYRLAFSGGPVDRDSLEGQAAIDWVRSWQTRAWGPRGDTVDSQAEIDLVAQLRDLAHSYTVVLGREKLLEAERAWYDRGECVEVRFTPSSGDVHPGGSIEIDAGAHSRRDGTPINGDTVTLGACGAGTGAATPSTGTSTLHFTLSDPGGAWTPGSLACVNGESISRRGRGTGFASFNVPDVHFFNVTVEGFDDFGWSKSYHAEIFVGTDSECITDGSGSGARSASYATAPGEAQLLGVFGDTLSTTSGAAMDGQLTQSGSYTQSSAGPGPGCPSSYTGPTDECGTRPLPGTVELKPIGGNRVRLQIAGPEPFDSLPDRCPVTWPGFVETSPDHHASPFLITDFEVALPMDELRDPTRSTVVVTGGHHEDVTEFCSAASSNNGGNCGPEETVTVTGTKNVSWKITLTRTASPF
jgi:hypothetical protein